MRNYKAEGIILKRTNFGEADRILTIYTKQYGKLRVLAKGVRKINSRRGGNLELFNHVAILVSSGRNLDVLIEVQLIDSFSSWRKNLKAVGVAYYFCELVDKLTAEGQEHLNVFELLLAYLGKVNDGKFSDLVVNFERSLLKDLGFGVPQELENSKKSLKGYIEEITEKTINSPKVIREIW